MKKKILVTGTMPSIVKDFINHTDSYFNCMSTTDCRKDLERHFSLFEPDGFIVFPESADDEILAQTAKFRKNEAYNGCPVFICASLDVCSVIQEQSPDAAELMLKRPVSADNLSLRIMKFFEEMENMKLIEEQSNAGGAAVEAAASAEPARKKHILIVDDDKLILKMLKSSLEDRYEVTTMVNGVLVEKFLSSRTVDLIILDYEMPMKTGAEVMRDLKSKDSTKDVPVCFLTGVDQREKIMEILSLKPAAYMLKPVNMESFTATISNLID